jgi:hypothetical protein
MTFEIAAPGAGALVESLRSVGYSLSTAIADIVDNSITANATNVRVEFFWDHQNATVAILDDGTGMTEDALVKGMRAGSSNPTEERSSQDLGRFGLGLKTASFSQCRRLTVWSKTRSSAAVSRRWDLDYVALHDEWRLQSDIEQPAIPFFSALLSQRSGTLVLWEHLDTLLNEPDATTEVRHQRFLNLVQGVVRYLSMVFHRFMEAPVSPKKTILKIHVNGNKLAPWNPFCPSSRVLPEASPVESISCLGSIVRVQGFILPHKDQLDENEFEMAAGPKGWNAHQGFYLYRNHRMIIDGDWLHLGPSSRPWVQEEQYRLARLSIEIGNTNDFEWGLDVKKATARPPAILWSRLTGLAERQRIRAKEIFVHRGQYGPRPEGPRQIAEHPWKSLVRGGRAAYQINRHHPLIAGVIRRLGPLKGELNAVLRLIEETVPVEKIWIDAAETDCSHVRPYEGLSNEQLKSDIKKTYQYLMESGSSHVAAVAMIRACEPFNQHPKLIEDLCGLST